jgi:nucleotide-binding universal stress UspA family protein
LPAVAAETGAGLIVVGSHGRTGLKRILIGSVAERTARLAPCSVLIARGDAPDGGYRRIVVGTDFTDGAKLALRQAEAAAATGATLDVIHCCHVTLGVDPIDPMAVASTTRMYADLIDQLRTEGETWIAGARTRADLTIAFQIVERPAITGLADTATESGADLVVVGSHGRRGLRRFMLGSVAEATARHARCSTLIAR